MRVPPLLQLLRQKRSSDNQTVPLNLRLYSICCHVCNKADAGELHKAVTEEERIKGLAHSSASHNSVTQIIKSP